MRAKRHRESPIPGLIERSCGHPTSHPKISCLKQAAAKCRACDLWKSATQTVFGDGFPKAKFMLVGEQPGDREDVEGRPFVGPAGKLLDEAIRLAGIDRSEVYLTNVVKHFRWSMAERGNRRIHKKPRQSQIDACRPWLEAEIAALRPEILVCLGATAAKAILGKAFSVLHQHGEVMPFDPVPLAMATAHPSSILRSPDREARHKQMDAFVQDLKNAKQALEHIALRK